MASQSQQLTEGEINLLDYWRVIWKYKWLIVILCSASVLTALILGLLSPKIYESAATVLIPKEGGAGGLLSAIAGSGLGQQIAGTSMPSLTPNRDLFISILKSRLMARYVVERFNLKERYGVRTLEEAVEAAKGIPRVSQSPEGLLQIRVEDTDPKMAADIANFYVEQLDRLVTQFGTATAGRQRRFIEEQIARTEKDLRMAEENLRQFQEGNRAFLLGDMANSMKLPGTRVPKVGLDLARLSRDVRVQETVSTVLTQQLQQAKIAEAQDTPVVQVLDRAIPALYKSGPRIKLKMMLAGAISLFVGILFAFFLEYIRKQRFLAASQSSNVNSQ